LSETFIPERAKGVDVILQYCITGPNGGNWNICVKDEKCRIEQGIKEKPTCKVTMGDQDFVDLVTGKLNPMKALSSGKVVAEGDMMKMQVIDKVFKLDFQGE
jgi:putative sterol carrier protein